jgi:SAM-dependent methyltransferase
VTAQGLSILNDRLVSVPQRLSDLTVNDIWHFIQVVKLELKEAGYREDENAKLTNFTHGLGNSFSRHAYYRQAYCRPLLRAMQYMFARWQSPRVLDIGCGTGGQAILFAASGASVVGLDLDELQISTALKRIAYFEQVTRKLDIRIHSADVTQCDFASYGQFDVAYSHGCIARYISAEDIFQRLRPALAPGGLLIMKNQNPECLAMRFTHKSSDLSNRDDFVRAANEHGYRPLVVDGTTSVPRAFWMAGEATHLVDWFLRPIKSLNIHLELIFEKLG